MTYIRRSFLRMCIFLVAMTAAIISLYEPLWRIFSHNLILNCVIISCLLLGIVFTFYQLYQLRQEQRWLDTYEQGEENYPGAPKAKILAPLAIMLRDPEQNRAVLSPLSARSILLSVESRLDEGRDLNRYLIGLLIFLGLLGTFWGLSETIGAITGVINGIDMTGGEVKDAFHTLKQGLQSPLSGMGIAFSSSMFGLASSLIIGFLDLQNSKASSAFYHNLEERLAANTRFGGSSVEINTTAGSGPAYSMGLLEQTIESMAALQTQMKRTDDNRVSTLKTIQTLSEKLAEMSEQISSHQTVIKKIAQNQMDLQECMLQLAKTPSQAGQDETVKQLLRSLDTTSSKVLEELVEGRNRTTQELRNEIRVIARTLSAIANGQEVAA